MIVVLCFCLKYVGDSFSFVCLKYVGDLNGVMVANDMLLKREEIVFKDGEDGLYCFLFEYYPSRLKMT